MDLHSRQPQCKRGRFNSGVKGYHVVPQDDQASLRPPLPCEVVEVRADPRGERLASLRVLRDQLLIRMEELLVQEAELSSVFELLDCTRRRCTQQRDIIVDKLELYERLLDGVVARRFAQTACRGFVEDTFSEEQHNKWERTREMVAYVLPQLLEQLDDTIADNSSKIRGVRYKMEEIRAQRLELREQAALRQEEIARALES